MVQYQVGQVIHHKRYNYRGVIAKADRECGAPDEWYINNQTQPDRDQPWYHVLVHGGSETYVAEENLELDRSGDEVAHPYVRRMFALFIKGRYHRFCPN
ncbi:MAG: heat shock protein HspQ [Candidatus Hydrogenedentes bacterium]|nr:heat shock protein HspQ [Candidatus Hydrogenedentota bacterium]